MRRLKSRNSLNDNELSLHINEFSKPSRQYPVFLWKQKVHVRAPRAVEYRKGVTPSSLRDLSDFFSFLELKIASFFCILSAIVVSSCTTRRLLWDDLFGSIAQGNRQNPQDPNGRSCFFNVSPYKSTVLFLISSFNPPLLPRRQTPKCIPIFIRN